MRKIFVINAGQRFGHSEGSFNKELVNWTLEYFNKSENCEIKTTSISDGFDVKEEVAKFVWADIIIYHTPIWWFSLPHDFKKYIDLVFEEGGQTKQIYVSDGRRSSNPKMNYGKGGALQGKKYMITTSWNAPIEAFTIENELFKQTSVDDGVMFGFHIMNTFIGMTQLDSFHFYDIHKDPQIEEKKNLYAKHLKQMFE